MRLLPAVLLASSWCCVFAQTYTISTFAGGGLPVNIPGTSATLYGPKAVAVDKAGNVFFADQNDVLRLDATTGTLTLVAGNGTQGFSGDNGPATSAQLHLPSGVAVDSVGNLYIADTLNARVRKVSNGVITTIAGGGSSSGDGGPATSASLYPLGVAVDSTGGVYIVDDNLIRKVSNGVITSVAGNGTPGFGGDNGPATSAQLLQPGGVAVDSAGNLYIADTFNYRIRKVSGGVITTVAGSGPSGMFGGFSGDSGPATSAQLSLPSGLAVDAVGNFYIADFGNNRIRRVSNGVITTVAGNGTGGFSGDGGPANSAELASPGGVAVDSVGNLYIPDTGNGRVRKVSNGVINTLAGTGTLGFSGDSGPATSAALNDPSGVAVDSVGNLYVADNGNGRVRKVSGGVITTMAGNGTQGFSGDNGPGANAQLSLPFGVAVDPAGNLYIADTFNYRVRKVSNGVITTVAGDGTAGSINGIATAARFATPWGVAIDSAGSLYIADRDNRLIRKVSNGVMTTVAGNGTPGFSGDNGPATSAELNSPSGIAVDSIGNFYIADTGNHRVRRVSNGVITTVAGNGTGGFSGDGGPATSAELASPGGVVLDSTGNLYIADTINSRIRKVSNGVITTIAGGGSSLGDNGPATSADLAYPDGVAVDSAGNVYVADSSNNRVRMLTPSIFLTPPALSITAVNNAASNLSGPIAPGEIVVVTGSGLGPLQITSAHVGTDGVYDPQFAGTSVRFNGTAAPMIYTSATQVAAIVPYEVTGANAQVTVTYLGQTSAPVTVAVVASAPGLFTLDSSGGGQAAVVNQNGSINTPSTPARIGSVISLFATGEGQTSPPGADGKPASGILPAPNLPVNVTIGGVTVNGLQYVGGAPGEVAGLLQINVQIPAGVTLSSAIPVVIRVGGATSQMGVTIAVAGN